MKVLEDIYWDMLELITEEFEPEEVAEAKVNYREDLEMLFERRKKDLLQQEITPYEEASICDSLLMFERERWTKISVEERKRSLITDNAYEEILNITGKGRSAAIKYYEKGERISIQEASEKIARLNELMKVVKDFNVSLAEREVSEGTLDYLYASEQTDCTSLGMGHLIRESKGAIDKWKSDQYVMRDNEATLFPEPWFSLVLKDTDKLIKFSKSEIIIGCGEQCDIIIHNVNVDLQQAKVLCEDGYVLLQALGKNATYINGEKIENGKKYQLLWWDEIAFDNAPKIIFGTTFSNSFEKVGEKYSVLECLSGGTSECFRVCDESGLQYVLKACNKNIYGKMEMQSLLAEKKILTECVHPMIPKFVEYFEDEENIYLVREFIEGESLSDYIEENILLTSEIVTYALEICDVLECFHTMSSPYVYCDMKPANIIKMPNGKLKLIDLGSTMIYRDKEYAGKWWVTPGYAAPELYVVGGNINASTDIYSLGMTMLHLFRREHVTLLDDDEVTFIPKGLKRIIDKCTEGQQSLRYQSAKELREDLMDYMRKRERLKNYE